MLSNLGRQLRKNTQALDLQSMEGGFLQALMLRITHTSTYKRSISAVWRSWDSEEKDVILAIDGVSIGNNGTVPFREEEPVDFNYLFPLKKPGETVLVKVLRKGRQHEFNINFKLEKLLVPDQYLLSYYILSGFVFVTLSKPFIDDSADMCECPTNEKARVSGEQIVIISKVMNGVEVLNLRHLRQLVEECCAEQLSFDLENGNVIAVNCKSAKEETSFMLEHHGIRSAMSKDLMKEASERASSAVA
ncbi:hypothetical protein F2Q70_00004999 [Brassica cretica]|uniref:Protease Do-like PDZ domain-containing protein n=1 Tax=Brassica cretica TaxID=69181 RepID=A0A8S9IRG4_BRACR|nr:hypothetical protein F2Q70_00004999 [Brassica cretica]